MSARADRKRTTCLFDGCDRLTLGRLGYCTFHVGIAYACAFDESCRNRCAAHSRSRLCAEHAWYSAKRKRLNLDS